MAPTISSPTLAYLNSTATTSFIDAPIGLPPENSECSLLGPFAIFVQGLLGLLALTALVFKRRRERPQRPIKIWFFDVSKQVVGSLLVHMANLAMSMLSSGQLMIRLDPAAVSVSVKRQFDTEDDYIPNPCSFYLLNLAIDTTIGIPILIFLLRIITLLFLRTEFGNPPESIESGNYGVPPSPYRWLKQCLIYFLGLFGMKICVLFIFLVLPWISKVGDWALKWTEGDEVLQVIFVMFVFPLIMNATQYYIIDSFIKSKNPTEPEFLASSDSSEVQLYTESSSDNGSDMLLSEDEDDIHEAKRSYKKIKKERRETLRQAEGV